MTSSLLISSEETRASYLWMREKSFSFSL